MSNMTNRRIQAVASEDGLVINGHVVDEKLPLERYHHILGVPSRTIDAGPPAPAGHRNNQVHIFDWAGVYLTENHASRLVESVNFVFDPTDSPFPIETAFHGNLKIGTQDIRGEMQESELDPTLFARDLPGEYSVKYERCWIGVSAKGHCDSDGRRRYRRYVGRVSVCF